MRTGLPGDLSPAMRQQFFKLFDGMFRNPSEHIAKPRQSHRRAQFPSGA
jgi:hypothetical protein